MISFRNYSSEQLAESILAAESYSPAINLRYDRKFSTQLGKSESQGEEMAPVKEEEVEDSLEEEHAPLHKRHRQQNVGIGGFALPASQYNPLDEPSPLGLRLRKSPSLLELIQMKLFQGNMSEDGSQSQSKKDPKCSSIVSVDKMKASNFPGSTLKVGTWEYKSRHEGDLVAKCYFAKHKIVWEVLDGGLKNKIEIQWPDIVALKAKYLDDSPGTLNFVLARPPLFFRETNPQPRKHTLWQATADFTGGQASIHRQHFLECPQGLLGKHFEKLIQCDPRLHFLSQQEEFTLDSPYFEPRLSVLDDPTENKSERYLNREGSPSVFSLQGTTSTSGVQSSTNDQDALVRHSGLHSHETPPPCSDRGTLAVADIQNYGIEQLKELNKWDQIKVPGLHSSMSMSDLVNHLEHRISEQESANNLNLSQEDWECLQILDDINRTLFSDNHSLPGSDEKSLMSRVNSLCCLLQKGTDAGANMESISEKCPDLSMLQSTYFGPSTSKKMENHAIPDNDFHDGSAGCNQTSNMPRNDSVGDLLLNLPRIASLPQFLFNISEDIENQAR